MTPCRMGRLLSRFPDAARAGGCRWAGLIRGAVSVALVYYFFDPKGQSEDSHRATLIAATLVCVMVSIIVFGALTKTLLDITLGPQGAPWNPIHIFWALRPTTARRAHQDAAGHHARAPGYALDPIDLVLRALRPMTVFARCVLLGCKSNGGHRKTYFAGLHEQ